MPVTILRSGPETAKGREGAGYLLELAPFSTLLALADRSCLMKPVATSAIHYERYSLRARFAAFRLDQADPACRRSLRVRAEGR